MIKTVIIEDEKPAARKLQRLLSLFPDLELVATINSVEEGFAWFSENQHPDLIFSDIVLGDGSVSYTHLDVYKRQVKRILRKPHLLLHFHTIFILD